MIWERDGTQLQKPSNCCVKAFCAELAEALPVLRGVLALGELPLLGEQRVLPQQDRLLGMAQAVVDGGDPLDVAMKRIGRVAPIVEGEGQALDLGLKLLFALRL